MITISYIDHFVPLVTHTSNDWPSKEEKYEGTIQLEKMCVILDCPRFVLALRERKKTVRGMLKS